jgi:hypothetical protein
MKLGTRSILFGAHCFFIHPWFVAAAWWKLYGFPRDPRLWVAFVIHDWGYWGLPEMDGPEGETHPELAADIMRLFGWEWHDLCLYHSRFYAKMHGMPFSPLCVADKLAIALTPAWLYLPMVTLTGEVDEYMATYGTRSVSGEIHLERLTVKNKREWFGRLQPYMEAWAWEHRDGKADTWTNRQPVDASGVYQ